MTRIVIEYTVQVIKTNGEILCHKISGITYTLRKSRHYGNIVAAHQWGLSSLRDLTG